MDAKLYKASRSFNKSEVQSKLQLRERELTCCKQTEQTPYSLVQWGRHERVVPSQPESCRQRLKKFTRSPNLLTLSTPSPLRTLRHEAPSGLLVNTTEQRQPERHSHTNLDEPGRAALWSSWRPGAHCAGQTLICPGAQFQSRGSLGETSTGIGAWACAHFIGSEARRCTAPSGFIAEAREDLEPRLNNPPDWRPLNVDPQAFVAHFFFFQTRQA